MLHNLSQPADSNKTNYIVETNQSFHVLVFSETPSALAKLYTGLDSGSELELTFSPTSNDDLPNHLQTAQLDEYNALLIDLSTFDISTLATIDFHNLDIPSIALLKENDLQQEAELFAIGINDCILFSELSSLHHTIFKNVQRSQLYSQQKEQKKSSKTTINLTNDNTDNVVDIQQTFLNKNTEFLNQLIDLNPNLIFVTYFPTP